MSNYTKIPPLHNAVHHKGKTQEEHREDAVFSRRENARRKAREDYLEKAKDLHLLSVEEQRVKYAELRQELEEKIKAINVS